MNEKKSSELTRSQELLVDEDMQEGGFKMPDTLTRLPLLGKAMWQSKDLKTPKYNGTVASCIVVAMEQ